MDYIDKLQTKIKTHSDSGFDCDSDMPILFPFQQYCTRLMLKKGRGAMFEDCGLGKTLQQIHWAKEVVRHTNKPVIGLAPLVVVAQTISKMHEFGIEVTEWVQGMELQHELYPAIYMTNYEQLEHLPADMFSGVFLDESSILKNHEGAYRNMLIEYFQNTPYKLCCTATPSPNDPMELGNHAEFLNVMSRSEMLAMYFVHDGGETAKWRLKGHSEKLFWDWVGTWAIMLSKPSDIGYSDDGYVLPPLNLIEVEIKTPKRDNGRLFNDTSVSATDFYGELSATEFVRLEQVAKIVNGTDESVLVWIKTDAEGLALRKLIPEAIEVKGSDKNEYKKSKLLGFANNEFRVLITKVKIAGYGMNFQNCHNMIFASPDFSFEGIYQALRRQLRFGQLHTVNAWIMTTDTMSNVIQSFHTKRKQHEQMLAAMQQSMNKAFIKKNKHIRMNKCYKSEMADIRLGDSLQLIDTLQDDSVGFSIWSPPFPELYVYSDNIEDLGNCKNFKEFMGFFSYIPTKLFPKMWAGRNVAIHCMDTPIQKGKEGYIGLRDFSGMIIQQMTDAGFIYHSRVTIWKNPVVEMQRTKALGLLHKQVKKDAAMSRVGIPDYLLVFRKPGEHAHPVKCNISVDTWQQYASPVWNESNLHEYEKTQLIETIKFLEQQVLQMRSGNGGGINSHQEMVWMDIDYGDTLNGRNARDEKDEKHICPLQLPTIERATLLWSNPGDPCLSMFGGIGSEPFKFLQLDRKAIAFELKDSYYDQMVKNVKSAEVLRGQATLFNAA